MKYNSTILGLQEYYSTATHCNHDFSDIEFKLLKLRYNRLKSVFSSSGTPSGLYLERYKGYGYKKQFVAGICLFPIPAVKHKYAVAFTQEICDYTEKGRALIHQKLKTNTDLQRYIMENPNPYESLEFNDNRISLFSKQYGLCGISKEELSIGNMEVHHIKPKELGGTDEFKNLIWVTAEIHKLIHATNSETIQKYLDLVHLDKDQIKRLNKYRGMAGNCVIV